MRPLVFRDRLLGFVSHLETVSVAAVQLQQALSAGSAGRRHGEGPLHVDHALTQPPLETEHLVQLLHLQSPEIAPRLVHRSGLFPLCGAENVCSVRQERGKARATWLS